MNDTERLARAVNRLGTLSTEEIREVLVTRGITGRQIDATSCPIAKLLTAETNFLSIAVSKNWIIGQRKSGRATVEVTGLPESIRIFIENFDENMYPELIRR